MRCYIMNIYYILNTEQTGKNIFTCNPTLTFVNNLKELIYTEAE